MKETIIKYSALLLSCLFLSAVCGCSDDSVKKGSINSFRDIPGITAGQIAEIEELISARESVSFGAVMSTEFFIMPDGTYSGFLKYLTDHLSGLFGIPFVLELHERDSLSAGVNGKTIDFTSDLAPAPEHRNNFLATAPIGERSFAVFVSRNKNPIKAISSLNGLRIGFFEETITEQFIRKAYPDIYFETASVSSIREAMDLLEYGSIDAVIADESIDYDFRILGNKTGSKIFPLIYTPISLITANPELKPFIIAINSYLEASGVDKLYEIYTHGENEYARFIFDMSLTPEEKMYIEDLLVRKAKVPVTMEPDNYPICFYHDNFNEFQGISVDIIKEISSLTGIEFETVTDRNTTMVDILEILKSGGAAFDAELIHTENRENDFIFPPSPYFTSHFAMLSRTDYPDLKLYQVAKAVVGVVAGTAPSEIYDLLIPDSRARKEYHTRSRALDALEKGEIDLFLTTDYMLLYQTHFREKTGYKINFIFNTMTERSFFGFNKNEEMLCSIMEKAQNRIDTDKIAKSWTNRVYDYSGRIARERLFYMSLFTTFLAGLFIVLILLFLKNMGMLSQINGQNTLLNTINQVSMILLEPDTKHDHTKFLSAMIILAKAVNVDRVTIWKNNSKNGELFSSLIYEWSKDSKTDIDNSITKNVPYAGIRWERILSVGDSINGPVRLLPLNEQSVLRAKGVVSIFIAPVFIDDVFWGYVGFDDCKKERKFSISESMTLHSAGRLFGNAVINDEMTEKVNASKKSLDSILNSIDAMIYVTDPVTSEILFINNSMKKHYGIEGDCVGQLCYKVLQKDFNHRCHFCPCLQLNEEPDKIIVWEEHSTLTKRVYRNVDRFINWPNGQTVHMQHSVDTTELVVAKEMAEQSSYYKSVFLANMSHEIRTPMNAILGIAEIQLHDKNLSPSSEDAFGKIYESGDLLLNIINDILDLSKIEAGKLDLVPIKYDIPSLVNDTAQLNRLRYESKPIVFTLNIDENTPVELFGDEIRIKQILNNILSNAFKYTDEGTVEFAISFEEADNDTVILVLRVSDTGHGMTEAQIGTLFDEYTRFNAGANRTTVGAGLGMSITKRLVSLMNGTIGVESQPGRGSVFTVRVPQKRISSAVCGSVMTEKLQNFRFHSMTISKKVQFLREYMPYGNVLVVDDVESNLYVANGMLLPYGLKIETVSSGFETIEKIKDGSEYDIIFMDHMMPKMDGIETTKILRGMGYKNSIIALTANALAGQAEMFMQNGFDGFISKPIDSRELNLMLNEFIRNRKPPEVVEAARREQREKESRNTVISAQDMTKVSEIEKFFVMDAENALTVLENIKEKLSSMDDSSINSYIIAVHGIKSALANVGEKDLSNTAYRLEKAGRARDINVISEETPSLMDALTSLIAKYKPADDGQDAAGEVITDENRSFLREKMQVIKNACADIDKKTAKAALNELRKKTWPKSITSVFDDIAVQLLHSEFRKAAVIADGLLN